MAKQVMTVTIIQAISKAVSMTNSIIFLIQLERALAYRKAIYLPLFLTRKQLNNY